MTTSNTPSPIDNGEAVGLLLSIHDIVPFDKDPRRSPNSEYARIKSSIRAQGLDQPLVVTRRPGVSIALNYATTAEAERPSPRWPPVAK